MSGLLRRIVPCVGLALMTALGAGCGSPPGTVSGTVKVNGQPLPKGLITFLSEVGNKDPYSAQIIDGKYQTSPIPAGPAKVMIIPGLESAAPSEPPKEGQGNDLMPTVQPGRVKKPGLVVPDKYQNAETSGLSLTVKSGENTFDVDMKP